MKKIIALSIIVMALFSMPVHAAVIMTSPTKSGGSIELTDHRNCIASNGETIANSQDAFIVNPAGEMLHGCWGYDSDTDKAIVLWDDGTMYTYNPQLFNLTPAGKKLIEKNK